jgi:hypothetical protein
MEGARCKERCKGGARTNGAGFAGVRQAGSRETRGQKGNTARQGLGGAWRIEVRSTRALRIEGLPVTGERGTAMYRVHAAHRAAAFALLVGESPGSSRFVLCRSHLVARGRSQGAFRSRGARSRQSRTPARLASVAAVFISFFIVPSLGFLDEIIDPACLPSSYLV